MRPGGVDDWRLALDYECHLAQIKVPRVAIVAYRWTEWLLRFLTLCIGRRRYR
jgi:hypothetical protein